MTVKDLIEKFDSSLLLEKLIELRPYILEFMGPNEKEKFKIACKKAHENILKASIIPNNEDVIVVARQVPTFMDDDGDYEVSSFVVSETKEGPYSFDGENCITCRYSIMFSPWEDILGREVCDMSLDLYGELTVASLVFHELIRMGFSSESVRKHIEEEVSILVERAENIKEEDCIPAEDAIKSIREDIAKDLEDEGKFEEASKWREWEDEKSEEEKQKEEDFLIKAVIINQNLLYNFKEYISKHY